ncbi:hypothetical protein [Psychroserpens sp.]|uniref:hypothetical protein n=1 Tax=Psychroserpens sp. TaxID=2020870 RepID=UPI003C76C434
MKIAQFNIVLYLIICLLLTVSCSQKESVTPTIDEINPIKVPSVENARSHFDSNSKISLSNFDSTGLLARANSDTAIVPSWDQSKTTVYKHQNHNYPQLVTILYTPIHLPTNGNTKMFIASIERDTLIEEKLFSIFYLPSTNPYLFSGYVLIFNLEGQLERNIKYIDGIKVEDTSTNNMNQRSGFDGDESGSGFTIGELLDFIGGDWFGLGGYIENNVVTVIANAPVFAEADQQASGTGFGTDWFDPSINIPAYPGSSAGTQGGNGNMYNPNGSDDSWAFNYLVFPHGLHISTKIGVDLDSIEANWLMNTATQAQLAAIADYLNSLDHTVDGNYNQVDIDYLMNSFWFQINNPNSTLTPDNSIDPTTAMHFDSFENFQDFIDSISYVDSADEFYLYDNQNGTKVTKFKGEFNNSLVIPVYLNVHITSVLNNISSTFQNEFELDKVNSFISGVTPFTHWEQDSYEYSLNNNITEVTINGHFQFGVVISGFDALSFTESWIIFVSFNNETGEAIDMTAYKN